MAKKGVVTWNKGINNRIERECLSCGKIFHVDSNVINKGGGKYCSRNCKGKWMSKNVKGSNNGNWRDGGAKTKTNCLVCGKEIILKSCDVKRGRGKLCSKKCIGKWYSDNRSGEKSHLWEGGLTPELKQIRNCLKYRQWRQDVFVRNDFTCQECGQRGGKLHAHHIKFFAELIEEVREYLPLLNLFDGAMLYTPLWDISNGITYCEECHKKYK